MNKEQIDFIRDKLGENKNFTELFLKDFILDSEKILTVYDYYEEKRTDSPRKYYFDSIVYILTNKRILALEIKEKNCFLKVINLDDVYKLEIDRDKIIPGELSSLKASDLLKTILIFFKNDETNIKIEFKDNPRYGVAIQKEKAFKFLKALNKILYS